MATHGRSGLGQLVLGSVAEAVLHGLSVPLLLAHPLAHHPHLEHAQALDTQA
jgi:nucleotide-binding universal stress UspA family protein